MDEKIKQERLIAKTQILIAPGYEFKIVKGLITNFHQPQSTLLLLVAALIGEEWKRVYDYALGNDFRFLSYGDGCLAEDTQMNNAVLNALAFFKLAAAIHRECAPLTQCTFGLMSPPWASTMVFT